jgi:Uncharacterised nucleotidyltransferase
MIDTDSPSVHALRWLSALGDPGMALSWSMPEWERIVRLARRLRLLARLAEGLAGANLIDRVPEQPRRHLIAEIHLSRWRTAAVVWAIEQLGATLGRTSYPLVLLKGAAYIGQDLPIAMGRLPSDLDILVPRSDLPDAQGRLAEAGWRAVELDEHDRSYYDNWSHEVPPMTHPLLAVELDLHHNILPPVGRSTVDAARLLGRLRPSKWELWQVLHPVDQVLHSATHLFFDSEIRDRLRDLVDLDGLFRYFGAEDGFWSEMPLRARELGLCEPLALACHFCVRWLDTPIPTNALQSIAELGPGRARRAWLHTLLEHVLLPAEPDETTHRVQDLAAKVLLIRFHRHRLPLRMLVPHLLHRVKKTHQTKTEARSLVARP